MKIRNYTESNYKAIFFKGKTLRLKLDNNSPITTPKTPELEDVAINNVCLANCNYCYTNATKHGKNFSNVVSKAVEVWGKLKENERPFQIAIGGAGESTMHPEWGKFIETVYYLGITPNYTTNGMHLTKDIIKISNDYCGGVAISFHPHLNKIFHESIKKFEHRDIQLNVHYIIGGKYSLEYFKTLYEKYKHNVDYFVILPYQTVGRAKPPINPVDWFEVFSWIKSTENNNFAFGALLYNFFINNDIELPLSLYLPEMFSGYRIMDDSYKLLRKSSYDLTPKYYVETKN